MKIVIVLLLLLIFASLGSALYYLIKDKGNDIRVVKSLTLRIGLSLFLFTLLMVGTYFGFIPL